MREKIEAKISECINDIIDQDHIEYEDYQILSAELARLESKEKAEKWEAENKERSERMAELMALTWGGGPK